MENVVVAIVVMLFLGVTIFVHEFGHYLAARISGLVVEVFSIGFGPAIWKKKYKGIVYKIGWIPFGGYVALPQLDPSGMSRIQTPEGDAAVGGEGERKMLPPVAAWKKIVVSLAGAAGNMILAVGIAWVVYWIGIPASPAERSAVVGAVSEKSEAYQQGLRLGDEVLSVNGRPTKTWRDVRMEAALFNEVLVVARSPEGETKTLKLRTKKGSFGEQAIPGARGRDLCMVLDAVEGSSAKQAGIRTGDIILELAGREVLSQTHLIQLVEQHKDEAVQIKVKRQVKDRAVLIPMTVTPRYDAKEKRTLIGIKFNPMAVEYDTVIRPTPGEQLREHATAIFRVLGALTTPKQAKAAQGAVGGPVAVIWGYWVIAKASVMLAVWFTGFLNVNLAIVNLLPIPVLDGGHIMFALWEICTRRRVSENVANALVNIFMVLLLGLFALLSIRDVDRFTQVGAKLKALFGVSEPTNAVPRETDAGNEPAEAPAPAEKK